MLDLNDNELEELAETLYDLKHDLGKYIKLPLALLPKDATKLEVAQAVCRGVNETRSGPRGVISAKTLIDEFDVEWGEVLTDISTYDTLKRVVARAIACATKAADDPDALSRDEVMADLAGVSEAIAVLISEVEGG